MFSPDTGHRAPRLPQRSSRLTYRRLRHPTPLPVVASTGLWRRYLGRLTWLFG